MRQKIAEEFYARWAEKLGIPLNLYKKYTVPDYIDVITPAIRERYRMFEREFMCKFTADSTPESLRDIGTLMYKEIFHIGN